MLVNPLAFTVQHNTITVVIDTPLFKSTHAKLKGVNLNQFVRAILEMYKVIYAEYGVVVNGRTPMKLEGKDDVDNIVMTMLATGELETHSVTLTEGDEECLRGVVHRGYGGSLRDAAHQGYGYSPAPQPSGYGDHPTISRYVE